MGVNVKYFEEAVDSQFICSHCHGVFVDPVLCICSHIFCWTCYKRRKKRNKPCLVCSEEMSVSSEPFAIEWTRQLGSLKVKCTKGCNTVVYLDRLADHFSKDCPLSMAACPSKGCTKKTRRMDLEDHLKKCDFRIVSCYCGAQLRFLDLRTHQITQKCVMKQNLRIIVKKRREMEQAIREHRLNMQKKSFEVECEQRRIVKSKGRLALVPSRTTTAISVRSEPALGSTVQKPTISRNASSQSAPAPVRTASLRTCEHCGKLFSLKNNHDRACCWHQGIADVCQTCGNLSNMKGCVSGFHEPIRKKCGTARCMSMECIHKFQD